MAPACPISHPAGKTTAEPRSNGKPHLAITHAKSSKFTSERAFNGNALVLRTLS